MIRTVYAALFLLSIAFAQSGASLSAAASVVDARSGSGTLTITASGGWRAVSTSSWLAVTPASGEGSATLSYSYSANPLAFARTATVTVAGETFTLTQASTSGAYTPWGVAGRGIITTAGGGFDSSNGVPYPPFEYHPPYSVAVDGAGNIYYADYFTQRIGKIDAATRTLSVVTGTGVVGEAGDGGPANVAQIYAPYGVALDSDGNLYIADTGNSRIRKVTAATGKIETLLDKTTVNRPLGLTFRNGNLYIADTSNHRILLLDSSGEVKTIAGTGIAGKRGGFENRGDFGAATEVWLNAPYGIAVDARGVVYFTDHFNNRVCKVENGVLTTIAGPGQLRLPRGLALDREGNLYVAEYVNHRVLKLAPGASALTVFAGESVEGYTGDGGPAAEARLSNPIDVAADAHGNIYIADTGNRVIRVVDNTTPAVAFTPASATLPIASGEGTFAVTSNPPGTDWQPVSSADWLKAARVGDVVHYSFTQNMTFFPRTATVTVAGAVFPMIQLPVAAALSSAGATVPASAGSDAFSVVLATAARWTASSSADWLTLARTTGLGTSSIPFRFSANPTPRARVATITAAGQLFIVTQAAADGAVNPWGRTLKGESETIASLPFAPGGLAIDANANIYVSDPAGGTLERIAAATGLRTTVAKGLEVPRQLAVDAAGAVYVSTAYGIVTYSAATGRLSEGVPPYSTRYLAVDRFGSLYAGNYYGQLLVRRAEAQSRWIPVGLAINPAAVAPDAAGNLFVTDTEGGRILRIDANTGDVVAVLDGLHKPTLVAVNGAGEIFFLESNSGGVRRFVPATGTTETLPFTGLANALVLDPAGNLYVSDAENNRIVMMDRTSPLKAYLPSIAAVTPAVSTAVNTQTFLISAVDLNGFEDIARIDFLFDVASVAGPNACQGFYNRAAGSITLTAGAGTQCEVARPTVSGALKTLQVPLTIVRRGDGVRQLYLRVTDAGGGSSEWREFASWRPLPPLPATIAVAPAKAVGDSAKFTFTASDPNGYDDIDRIEFVLSPTAKPDEGICQGYYDRGRGAVVTETGSCGATLVSATGAGTDLTVVLSMTPREAVVTGAWYLYARVGADWQLGSVWDVEVKLTKTFLIAAPEAARVYFLLNTVPQAVAGGCHGFWARDTGNVLVFDDTLTSPVSFQNSQCKVENFKISGTGQDRVLEITLTRKGAYSTGTLNLYSWVVGDSGPGAGWQFHSAWYVPMTGAVTKTFDVPAPNAERVYFLIHTEPAVAANTCHGFWDRASGQVSLYNDNLNGFAFPQNSQCTIPMVTQSGAGADLALTMRFTRVNAFAVGTRNVYVWRTGLTDGDATWRLVGTWVP